MKISNKLTASVWLNFAITLLFGALCTNGIYAQTPTVIPVTGPTTINTVTAGGASIAGSRAVFTTSTGWEYDIDDGATLTIAPLAPISGNNNGSIGNISGAAGAPISFVYTVAPTPGSAVGSGTVLFQGPGIYNQFSNNSTATHNGGAFYLTTASGTMNLTNATLDNFWVNGVGGAIYAQTGTMTFNFNNVTFSNNFSSATNTAYGGALNGTGAGSYTMIFNNVNFLNNSGSVSTAAAATGWGGALFMSTNNTQTSLTMTGGTISGNSLTATAPTPAAANANVLGGAIYAGAGAFSFSGVSFVSNTVSMNAGSAATGAGGALYLTTASLNQLSNVVFSSNKVATTSANTATAYGGAIYFAASPIMALNVQNASFLYNSASTNASTGVGNSGRSYAYGGAIYLSAAASTSGSVVFNGVNFTGNVASSLASGATSGSGLGGALYYAATSGVASTINNGTFAQNIATGTSKGNVGWGYGGAIYMTGGSIAIGNVLFSSNTASGVAASGIAKATGYGGAIYLEGGAAASVTNAYFNNNGVYAATPDITGTTASAQGGGIFSTGGGSLVINSSTFANNTAIVTGPSQAAYGGAVYSTGNSVNMQTVVFRQNYALNSGGALYLTTGVTGTLSNVLFSGNQAQVQGGAISLNSSNTVMTINGGTFSGNTVNGSSAGASGNGGAIYNNAASLILNDAMFTSNTAIGGAIATTAGVGGAIAANNQAVITFNVTKDTAYLGNEAYAANTTVTATAGGFLQSNGNSTANFNIAANKTLTIGSAANVNADTFGGSGTMYINAIAGNSGTLVLNGDSSASSITANVNGGAMFLANQNAGWGGNIRINSGATFGGAGIASSLTRAVTVNSGGTLRVGYTHTSAQTLTVVGDLVLNAGSILDFGLYSGNTNDKLIIGGTINQVGGSTVNINNLLAGTYELINVANGLGTFDSGLLATTLNGVAVGSGTASYDIISGTSVLLTLTGGVVTPVNNNVLTWTGSTSGNWISGVNNWSGLSNQFQSGDKVIFDDTVNNTLPSPVRTITVQGGEQASDMVVSGTGNYTFVGSGSIVVSTATFANMIPLPNPTGALLMQSTGTLTLANTGGNYFQGGINITAGNVVGNVATLNSGTGGITTAANTNITFDQATDATYSSTVTGAGNFTKANTGNLTLSGTTNYTGATTVNGGALTLANANQIATSSTVTLAASTTLATGANAQNLNQLNGVGNIVAGAGALTLSNNTASTVYSGTISGAAAITKAGANTLTLTGNNTSTGAVTIASGTLQLGDGTSANGTLASTAAITNNAVLALNHGANSGTMANVITGNGLITKLAADTGMLTLTADSSAYTGTTAINAGRLIINGAKLGGQTNVASGAALAGNGTLGSVTAANNSVITVGLTHNDNTVTTPQTLTLTGALTLNAGATLQYDLYNGNQSDLLNVGSLSILGTGTVALNNALTGNYKILSSGAALAASTTTSFNTTAGGASLGGRTQALYSITGNDLYLQILTSNTMLTWTGATTLAWNSADANWTGGDTKFVSGDSVTFEDTQAAAAKRTVSIAAAVIASDMTVNTAGTYAFTGAGGITTGTAGSTLATATGALTKLGIGVLDFTGQTGVNTFNSGINLGAGSIIGAAAELGTGTGAVTTAASTTLTFAQAANAAYASNITGAGNIAKTLAGNLTLSGTTNYTGATTVNGGALTLANANQIAVSSTVTLAASTTLATGANAQNLNQLNGAGNIVAGAGALTLSNSTASTVYSGTISGAATITKTGANTLTLTGNNTSTGAVTIASGTLQLGDGTSANGTLASTAAITNNAVLALNHGATSGTMVNVITGNGLITKLAADTGTLTLIADSSAYTGTTNINAGALVLNGAGAKLGGQTNLASGAALAGNGTLGNLITSGNNVITVGLTHNDSTVTTPQTLAITGTLSLAASTTLRYDLYSGNQSDLITVGSLVRTGTTTIDLNNTTNTGTYTLITSAAALATTATNDLITTLNGNALGQRSKVTYFLVGNSLDLSLANSNLAGVVWNGTNTGLWQNNYSNWKTSDGKFLNGDSVIFDDTLSGTRTVTVDNAGVTASDMMITTTGSYVFTGGAITTSTANTTLTTATGALTKLGTGIAILNNSSNNFTAGIFVSAGTLQGNNLTLGTGTAGITNNAVLVFDQAASGTYTNAIIGTGSLVKQNTGALTLTGSTNKYTGGINVAAGTLNLQNSGTTTQGTINIANAALLNIASGSSYTIQNALTGSGTFAIALNTASSTVAFTSAAGSAYAGTVKLGQSAFTLDTTAATALTNATLDLTTGNTTTVASGTQTIGNLALDGAKITFSATVPADPSAAGVIKTSTLALNSGTVQVTIPTTGLPNPMPAGSNLLSQDDGTTITKLITANTVTGAATNLTLVDQSNNNIGNATAQSVSITEGGVQVATGTYNYALTSTGGLNVNYKLTALALTANQTLHLAPDVGATGANAAFSATITGNGNLSINAANAPVTLAANNTFTGTTSVTSGTLVAGASNALGSATNTLNLAANTAFNLGGYTQTLGNLTTAANTNVNLGGATGTLTIGANGLNTAASSTINIAGGVLTVNGGTSAGALAGAGTLNFASGTTALATANNALTANSTIAANAAAVLNDTAALGSGTINLAAATSALSLNNVTSGTLANILTGAGMLTTAGSGTVTIAKANTGFTGQTNVNNGRLIAANTQALGTGAINVAAPANLDYIVSGTIANSIAGTGTLNLVASTGTTTLTSSNGISNINVLNGANVLASNVNALGTGNTALAINNAVVALGQTGMSLGDITLAGTGQLTFAPPVSGNYKAATAKSLTSTGNATTLVFNTNLGQNKSDTLNVTGAVNGAYNLTLNNTGAAPTSGTVALNLITAASGAPTYTPTQNTISFGGITAYDISVSPNGAGATINAVNNNQFSELGNFIVDTIGAAPLIWYSELDTVNKRMGDIRLDTRAKPGLDLWTRAYAQRYNVNHHAIQNGAGFSDDHYGMDVGADYGGHQGNGTSVYIGGYIGYGGSSRTVDNTIGNGHTDSVYGGVYATIATDDGWYADVAVKYNDFTNNFVTTAAGYHVDSHYKGYGWGASVELGKEIKFRKNWYVTPQVQAAYANFSSNNYTTSNGVGVMVASGKAPQVRAGAQSGYRIQMSNGQTLAPYVKLSGVQQWSSGGQASVTGDEPYSTSIKGARMDLGAGVDWAIAKGVQVYLDYEFAYAEKYTKPYGLTAGFHYEW